MPYLDLAKIVISVIALILSIISVRIAYKIMRVAKFAQGIVYDQHSQSKPLLEILGDTECEGGWRVVIAVYNLRRESIKIESILTLLGDGLSDYSNLVDLIEANDISKYSPIYNAYWNPVTNGEFKEQTMLNSYDGLLIKEVTRIAISIPEYKKGEKYAFLVQTNIGAIFRVGKTTNCTFPNSGESYRPVPEEIKP